MDISTSYRNERARGGSFTIFITGLVLIGLFAAVSARGMTDVYQLSAYTGTATNMSGSTQLFGAYQANASSSLTNIGFDFYFDGQRYTTFSVTSSGLMAFGTRPYATYYPYYWPNSSNMSSSYPAVCAYWGRYFYPASDGKVHYKLTGTAPNRVLTVEWLNVERYGSSTIHYGTYQVRLYERTNKIEFYYGNMSRPSSSSTSYSAAIGIAASSTRYINVYGNNFPSEIYQYPSGGYYTYYRAYYEPITNGTIYAFSPCERTVTMVGNTLEGGTEEMASGDELLVGKETMRGDNAVFHPFSIVNPDNACNSLSYTMSISGPAAADYGFPTNGALAIGQTLTPDIVFTPQRVGDREAMLTIDISNGERYTYVLKATGVRRIDWIGDVSQGGTSSMEDGDLLMTDIEIPRGSSNDYTPFTLRNINVRPGTSDAEVTYILDDPYNAYAIRLEDEVAEDTEKEASIAASTTLVDYVAAGETSTPIITFAPHRDGAEYGAGPQPATLTIIADTEVRVFKLNGFSIAPAAEFYFNGDQRVIGSDGILFRDVVTCVGEQATTVELKVENVNRADVHLNALDVYEMDSRVRQGEPKYPMETDLWGNLVPIADYFITEAPGVAPTTANARLQFPIVIRPGETRTFYLTYVAQMPGKRYGRVFLRTNCVNFFGDDADNFLLTQDPGDPTEGLMTLEFFGRGLGSSLASNPDGDHGGVAVTFDPVKVGYTGSSEATIYNTGDCDLRISGGDLRLTNGDVSDFELTEVFAGVTVDANGDFVIPPGGSGTIKANFTPSRSGSRRAEVLLRTNDSTLYLEGITERGVFYLNLYGVGKADLRTHDLVMRPAVIDGPGSTGAVLVENTSTEIIEITGVALTGPNTDEIVPDPANPWPTLPVILKPGETLEFGMAFNALAGSTSGPRAAALEVSYGSDMITAQIQGVAGTRLLMASQSGLFEGIFVPVGEFARQIAVITNSGSFPVTLSSIGIEGAAAGDYTFSAPERLTLDPGASEFFEVTYAPLMPGQSTATLVFSSNATGGDVSIALGGTATGTQPIGGSGGSAITRHDGSDPFGAARSVAGTALRLESSVPNPARNTAEIVYALPESGVVELSLYDLTGRVIATIVKGERSAGEHAVVLDVNELATGRYYYALRTTGGTLTRSLEVVK